METLTKVKNSSAKETSYSFSEQLEAFKKQLDAASKNSKGNINAIITSCSSSYEKAIDANKKFVNELREKLKGQPIDTAFLDDINNAFVDSMNVSDYVIDSIIDSHMCRVSLITENHKKNLEVLSKAYSTDEINYDDLLKLYEKEFEQSIEQSNQDMKNITEVYNKHLNLSQNFSKLFSKNINSQIDTLVKLQ